MKVKHIPSADTVRQQGRITLDFSQPYAAANIRHRPPRAPDDHEMWRLARALRYGLIDDNADPSTPARARLYDLWPKEASK